MDTIAETLKTLPHSPGVYIYKDSSGTILYVGKARNLNKRVHMYFGSQSLLPEKTKQLVSQIHSLRYIQVGSEFDALLLEAKLIRQYEPKYNSITKDDKSPLYINICSLKNLPIIVLSRKVKVQKKEDSKYYGPFPSKKIALSILRILRHSIPYCQQKKRNGDPCFYTHIGLCNPCPSVIEKMPEGTKKEILMRTYRANIKRMQWVLSGHSLKTIRSMQRQMYALSKTRAFEKARILRDQINILVRTMQTHYDPFVFEETDKLELAPEEQLQNLLMFLQTYYPNLNTLDRIECYDISNLHGADSVGSMIVFSHGIPYYDQYRKFKIRETNSTSDVAMIKEVIQRRLRHTEWPFPQLIVVDGGKTQVNVIHAILEKCTISAPVIGLSKRLEQIIIKPPYSNTLSVKTIPLSSPGLQLLQRIRDEAHRFAISYHRQLRKEKFAS